MRIAAPDDRPVTLTIAGSDSGGGAGIQADLKTMEAFGAFGTSAITAVTAQNTQGVNATHVLPTEHIDAQLDAVLTDFEVHAAKTGMLATTPVIDLIASYAEDLPLLVVDPVMVAASGDRLLDPEAETAYEDLIGRATLTTPNAHEAEVLTGIEVTDHEHAVAAGEALLETGVDAVLVKGGHVPGPTVDDVLVTPDGVSTFTHPRIDTEATHGSGCTLASAITTQLAHDTPVHSAVEASVTFMERAVRYHLDVGTGPGAVHHLVGIRERAARDATREAVETIVREFVDADIASLVPEVGMNVAGATPYAESPREIAAVEGRITRTIDGIHPARGVRFGASNHVARFLLAARERDPTVRFAINCRFNAEIEAALATLDYPVVEINRQAEPAPDVEGTSMDWVAQTAFDIADGTPTAVYDHGDVGKEAITRILASDPTTAIDSTLRLANAVDETGGPNG